MQFAATLMDLEGFMLSEVSQKVIQIQNVLFSIEGTKKHSKGMVNDQKQQNLRNGLQNRVYHMKGT